MLGKLLIIHLFIIITVLLSLYANGNELFYTVSGYGKTMYVHDDRLAPKLDQSTFGIGGKLALQTDEWEGFSLKAAYYVTSDLGLRSSNPKKTDAYMFDVNKTPYSLLGEALIEYKNGASHFIIGRQEIDTPIISTYDYRIIPNLFESYTYIDTTIPHTTLTLAYVSKMSGLDGLVSFKNFKSMSQQTYTSLAISGINTIDSNGGNTVDVSKISGDQGVIMSGIVYDDRIKFQGWNYYCHDVIDEFYIDIAYPFFITPSLVSTIEMQGYGVREEGRFGDFLHRLGLNGSYELYGMKVSLEEKNSGISVSAAYNFFTGDKDTVTAFGNWGGYPEYVAIPYMFAQDDAVSALAKSSMEKINLKYTGLARQTLIAGYSFINLNEAIMPHSDIDLINLVYKLNLTDRLGVKMQYEWRDSDNFRYANDMLTLSMMYRF